MSDGGEWAELSKTVVCCASAKLVVVVVVLASEFLVLLEFVNS